MILSKTNPSTGYSRYNSLVCVSSYAVLIYGSRLKCDPANCDPCFVFAKQILGYSYGETHTGGLYTRNSASVGGVVVRLTRRHTYPHYPDCDP